ncbi:MAG: ferritin [Tannerellaceae bacterium]|jgi:ferritin|nr:ferritin [Tannerellaceae bacterium]
MLNDKMQKELNQQINAEFWSAYLYLSMSAWFAGKNLPGLSHWMYVQFQEEQDHAMKIFRYIYERGGNVTLAPIADTPTAWKSPSEAFRHTLQHEQKVTASFNSLMDLAVDLKDYATQNFLSWFINEQVEEEATASEILQTVSDIELKPGILRMFDKELKARVYSSN